MGSDRSCAGMARPGARSPAGRRPRRRPSVRPSPPGSAGRTGLRPALRRAALGSLVDRGGQSRSFRRHFKNSLVRARSAVGWKVRDAPKRALLTMTNYFAAHPQSQSGWGCVCAISALAATRSLRVASLCANPPPPLFASLGGEGGRTQHHASPPPRAQRRQGEVARVARRWGPAPVIDLAQRPSELNCRLPAPRVLRSSRRGARVAIVGLDRRARQIAVLGRIVLQVIEVVAGEAAAGPEGQGIAGVPLLVDHRDGALPGM